MAERGKTVHGEAANAGHRVLAPDDAEVEAYLEAALKAPPPERSPDDRPSGVVETAPGTVVVLDFGSQFAQLIARRVRELDVYSELLPHDTPYEELVRRGARANLFQPLTLRLLVLFQHPRPLLAALAHQLQAAAGLLGQVHLRLDVAAAADERGRQ